MADTAVEDPVFSFGPECPAQLLSGRVVVGQMVVVVSAYVDQSSLQIGEIQSQLEADRTRYERDLEDYRATQAPIS